MKHNNRKTWKAITAIALMMASLFIMSSIVSAGVVELLLGEEGCEVLSLTSSSQNTDNDDEDGDEHEHEWLQRWSYYVCSCGVENSKEYFECSCGEKKKGYWEGCNCLGEWE